MPDSTKSCRGGTCDQHAISSAAESAASGLDNVKPPMDEIDSAEEPQSRDPSSVPKPRNPFSTNRREPEPDRQTPLSRLLLRVYRSHHDDLLARARSVAGNPEDAEDLVQELYVQLPKLISEDKILRSPFAFLCGCLRRWARNLKSRQQRHADLLAARFPRSSSPDPIDLLDATLACEEVLTRLPPVNAQLLRMRYLEDKSARQIADYLGISEAAARFRLHYALKAVRRQERRTDPTV